MRSVNKSIQGWHPASPSILNHCMPHQVPSTNSHSFSITVPLPPGCESRSLRILSKPGKQKYRGISNLHHPLCIERKCATHFLCGTKALDTAGQVVYQIGVSGQLGKCLDTQWCTWIPQLPGGVVSVEPNIEHDNSLSKQCLGRYIILEFNIPTRWRGKNQWLKDINIYFQSFIKGFQNSYFQRF